MTTKTPALTDVTVRVKQVVFPRGETPSIAATPPMGWNSWNHYATKIDDSLIRAQAEAMVSSGMKAAGYQYVNIDDGWEGNRDASGFIHCNEKFPDMKALAEYVHSLGLKIGIYSSPGPKTCAGFEGSLNHEEQDAQTYADWGFDFLKYDWCTAKGDMKTAFRKMRDALRKTGRPMVYSLSQYGEETVWSWAASAGANMWRTTSDITDNYDRMCFIGFMQSGLEPFAGAGHWNDPDMLEVGNGGMNEDEYRTHMSLWCLLAAPLLAGNDLTTMDDRTIALLTNPEIIAVDQDSRGIQGHRVATQGPLEVWTKPLMNSARAHGNHAVGLFNRGEAPMPVTVRLKEIGFAGTVKIRDLWHQEDLGSFTEHFTATIPRHGAVMLRMWQD